MSQTVMNIVPVEFGPMRTTVVKVKGRKQSVAALLPKVDVSKARLQAKWVAWGKAVVA